MADGTTPQSSKNTKRPHAEVEVSPLSLLESAPKRTSTDDMDEAAMVRALKEAFKSPEVKDALSEALLPQIRNVVKDEIRKSDYIRKEFHDIRVEKDNDQQHSRMNSIRLLNVPPYKKPGERYENTNRTCIQLFRNELSCNINHRDLVISHRLPRPNKPDGTFDPIICHFVSNIAKGEVMSKQYLLRNLKDDKGKIEMYDDLTPMKSKAAFEARKLKKSKVIADTWVFRGRVWVTPHTGDTFQIYHEVDLEKVADAMPQDADPSRLHKNVRRNQNAQSQRQSSGPASTTQVYHRYYELVTKKRSKKKKSSSKTVTGDESNRSGSDDSD